MNSGLSIIDGVSAWRDAQRAWQEAGCSAREAELLASSHTAGLVRLPGEVSVELLEAAEWEQLAVWPAGGDTYLAGSVAGFGALLKRWPAAAGIELATSLADALGVCWRPSRQMRWPGQAPAGWGRRPVVMGILNVTPDSFSDGGRFATLEAAVARGLEMVAEGAGIIDVGGESTRPGAPPVSAEEEAERVVPVISSLAKRVNVPISVDTYKAVVAEAAVAAGAAIINDISGLRDPAMAALAARAGVPTVVMHMQGTPHTMQRDPHYTEVVAEVVAWLEEACDRGKQAGVDEAQLIIDPGIGFGKSAEHNLELLRRLRDLRSLGYPVLVGTSRKSLIGHVLGLPVDQRLEGTAATVALSVREGADIVRVHDVGAMRRVVDMSHAVMRGTEGRVEGGRSGLCGTGQQCGRP